MAQNMMVAKTQLYLVLELAGSEPTVERYGALFDPQIVPSLLIVPEHDRKPDAAALQAFVAVAQHHDVAVLIADDVELAAETGADGVHLSATSGDDLLIERYRAARESLGANAIIGGDAGFSRHDAMALGEAGANYVAFSPRTGPAADQSISPEDAQRDMVSWWADIFEIPVVALGVADEQTARSFAGLNADFVARKVPAGLSPADLRDWLQSAHKAVSSD